MIDQEARDLAVRNHETTFLVEAAAGTGKTTLTVQRILALVESGVKIERIAAVTFTVKAAGELKERLRQEFSSRRETLRASEALNNLDHMAVNTIHGFCSDLLRALPVEAKLEPGFQVTDELEQSAMRREFWNSWLRDALNRETPVELDLYLEFGNLTPANVDFGAKRLSLFDLFETFLGAPSLDLISFGEDSHQAISAAESRLRQTFADAHSAIASCTDETDKLLPHIVRISQLAQKIPQDLLTLDAIAWLRANAGIGAKNVGRAGAWTGAVDVKAAKQIVDEARDALASLLGAIFTISLDAIAQWLRPAAAAYREHQRAQGRIGFDDLLRATRDMLRQSQNARRIFKSQFDYLHIDEFQDTDPTQTEIIFFLAENDDEHALDWRDVNLKPGKLFLVGDPKQSIYRFRGADLRIYNEAMRGIERQGRVLRIQTNFRSDEKILREVNGVFESEMTGQSNDAPGYVALVASESNPSSAFAVEILAAGAETDRSNAHAMAESEAEAIVSHIKSMVSRGMIVRRKHDASSPLSYKDAAILLRTGTHLDSLTDALRAADVPYVSFMNDAFIARTEIESSLTLLAALADPQDTMSVLGALRSPWFAIADDELLLHRYHAGSFVYTTPQDEDTVVGRALNMLRRWHEQLRHEAPSALLEHLLSESHAPAIYGMKSQGVARYQNLGRLVELMRRLEAGGESAPLRIVERLRGMTKLADAVDSESHSPADAVRILTIHKAKGLEFPFVYLYRIAPSEKTPLVVNSSEGDRTVLAVRSGGAESNGFAERLREEAERQKHEETRCLYVAMTRACHRLIIPIGWTDTYSALTKRYDSDDASHLPADVERTPAQAPQQEVFSPDAPQRQFTGSDERSAAVARERFEQWRAQRSASLCMRGSSAAVTSASEQEKPVRGKSSGRSAAMRIGTLVHSALEALGKSGEPERALKIAASREIATPDELNAAQLILGGGLHQELEELLRGARAVYSEMPFTRLADGEIHEGKIDLLVHSAQGKWVVVDYKTDDVTSEDVALRSRNYEAQMRSYAGAVESLIGRRADELWLYFLRPRRIHKIAQ